MCVCVCVRACMRACVHAPQGINVMCRSVRSHQLEWARMVSIAKYLC